MFSIKNYCKNQAFVIKYKYKWREIVKNEFKEIVKEETTYKAPVGKKFKKIMKVLGSLGLAATLALGATIFTSCKDVPSKPINPNPSTPVVPVDPIKPVDPEDKEKILFETSIKEYNGIVATIKNANSLTTSVETTNGDGAKVFEIQNNKLKLTENQQISFVETTQDQTFEYTLQNNEWHKNLSTQNFTAQTLKSSLCETLGEVEWISAKQENNQITLNGKTDVSSSKLNVSCQYNTKNNSLVLTTPNQTMSVYNVDATLVNLPTQFVDNTQEQPPVEEEFKITAENIEEMKEKMRPHVEMICLKTSQRAVLKDVYSTYLTKSEDSKYVNTIGAVFTMEMLGSTSLIWAEIKIPTDNKDITFERLYKGEISYNRSSITYDGKFAFDSANEEKEQELVQILKTQTLKDDYKKADWTGWYGLSRLGQDPHTLVMVKDNMIYEYKIEIQRSNSTLTKLQVAKENFLGKEPSKDTYSQVLKTYNVYEGDKEFLAIQAQEKEQNI